MFTTNKIEFIFYGSTDHKNIYISDEKIINTIIEAIKLETPDTPAGIARRKPYAWIGFQDKSDNNLGSITFDSEDDPGTLYIYQESRKLKKVSGSKILKILVKNLNKQKNAD